MRNLFALIGLAVVGFGAIGWYCGWYKLNFTRNDAGNIQIQTELQTKKVTDDSASFFQQVGKLLEERAKKNDQPASAPGTTPGPMNVEPPPSPPATQNTNTFQGGWLFTPARDQPSASRRQ